MTGQLQLDDKLAVWIPLAGAADPGLQRLAPRRGARGKARQRVGEAPHWRWMWNTSPWHGVSPQAACCPARKPRLASAMV